MCECSQTNIRNANVTPKKRLICNWVKIEGEPKIERKKSSQERRPTKNRKRKWRLSDFSKTEKLSRIKFLDQKVNDNSRHVIVGGEVERWRKTNRIESLQINGPHATNLSHICILTNLGPRHPLQVGIQNNLYGENKVSRNIPCQ